MNAPTGPIAHISGHPIYEEDLRRFMTFVEKLPNGCWFWAGARSRGKGNKKWYGSFWVSSMKRSIRSHRFSCEVLGGKECPPEHDRDHTCLFSLCVNYEHLDIVHKTVNQERKMERRRQADFVSCAIREAGE